MDNPLYSEKMRMLKGVLSLLFVITAGAIVAFGIWYNEEAGGEEGIIILVSMIVLATMLLLIGFILRIKITVTKDAVTVKWIKNFNYSAEEIESCTIMGRKEIFKEFYGYGLRYGRYAKGFTVNQTDGVRLRLKGRKDVVICSEKPEELKSAIDLIIRK